MLFRQTTRSLTVLAPAKLNLSLRIVSRRPDGFHDLETVMAAINLYDTLTFEETTSGQVELSVVDGSPRTHFGSSPLEAPIGPENLVIRAANLLRQLTQNTRGVRVTLVKRIPSSAGLGGGSSDSAAALAGLNRFWELSLTRAELIDLASQLGSDVAFFLADSPVALCTGRGERVEPLRISTPLHFVLSKFASGLSTPAVFQKCTPDRLGRRVEDLIEPLRTGAIGRLAQRLHNGLQAPAETLSDAVRFLRQKHEQLPVVGHQMSGSGSSYFGICSSRRQAQSVAGRLRSAGVPWVQVVQSCP